MNFSTKPTKALPFITIDESNGKFIIDQRAVDFLESIPAPVGIVCVAGKYRTGKSTFLNRVLLDLPDGESGFTVGGTVQACTKGLWIYTDLMGVALADGSTMSVLVIDTEGLGAFSATATHDSRIFALALLVSSFFIYNSVGTIDEQAISNLSLVSNISKHVRARSDESAAIDQQNANSDAEELGQLFPHFLWLIRDFSLQLRDENGISLTENQYLENALADKTSDGSALATHDDAIENSDKNRLRQLLRAYFPHRSCATLVRPCANETDLQRVDQMPASQLRSEFRLAAKKLRAQIVRSVPTKMVQGRPVSGRGLVCLANSYVNALNSGAAPVIRDSWALLAEVQFRDAIEESESKFKEAVDGESLGSATACCVLDTILDKAASTAFLHFDKSVPETSGSVYESFANRLHQKLIALAQEARRINETQLRQLVLALTTPLAHLEAGSFFPRLIEQRNAFNAQIGLADSLSAAQKRAFESTLSIWRAEIETLLLDALARNREQIVELQEQMEVLKAHASGPSREKVVEMQREYEEKIFQIELQLVSASQQQQSIVDAARLESQEKLDELNLLLRDAQERVRVLEEQCTDVSRLEDAQNDAARLRDEISLLQVENSQTLARANAMQSDFKTQMATLRQEMLASAEQMRSTQQSIVANLREQLNSEQSKSAALSDAVEEAKRQQAVFEQRLQQQKTKIEKQKEQIQRERAEQSAKLDEQRESTRKEIAVQHAAHLELLKGKASAEAQVERLSERLAALQEKVSQEKPNVEAERALALLARTEVDLKDARARAFDLQRLLEDEKQKSRNLERQVRDQTLDHEMAKLRLEMQYQVSANSESKHTAGAISSTSASTISAVNLSQKRDISKISLAVGTANDQKKPRPV